MKPAEYVKKVTKKIMCSRRKREDIARQLLAEIDERLEEGESAQDVLSSMGSVKEAAASFNDSLSPKEVKRYKRKRLLSWLIPVLCVVAMLLVLVWCLFPSVKGIDESGIFQQEKVEEQLVYVIDCVDAADYDTLRGMSTDTLKAAIDPAGMEQAKAQVCADWGDRTGFGNVYMQELDQMGETFAVCQVNVSYENAAVTYTISFDRNMNLAGLFMK